MPDPTGVRITVPTDLADAQPQILSFASNIETQLDNLWQTQLAPLRDSWIGSPAGAAMSWNDLQTRWNLAARDLMTTTGTLGSLGRTVGVNWNNYAEAEATNARAWKHGA